MLNKHAIPFILAAIASGLIMGFSIPNALGLYGGLDAILQFPALVPGIVAPGIIFVIALWYRFRSEVDVKRFAISGLYMLILWLILFGASFNLIFVITMTISSYVGIFAIWWIMYRRHGIKMLGNSWKSALLGLASAAAGYIVFAFTQGIESLPFFAGIVVFSWQLSIGFLYSKPRISMDERLAKKIDEIGEEEID